MAIEKQEYYYTVESGDNLVKIAEKHGLYPELEWAQKIWESNENGKDHDKYNLHEEGEMPNGEIVKRQVHIGDNKYNDYNHYNFLLHTGISWQKPQSIILYSGEKIWIPKDIIKTDDENVEVIELTDNDLRDGVSIKPGFDEHILIVPAINLRIDREFEEVFENEKYTLSSSDYENYYKKTLIIKDDGEDIGGMYQFRLAGIRKDLKYNLEYDPGRSKD